VTKTVCSKYLANYTSLVRFECLGCHFWGIHIV